MVEPRDEEVDEIIANKSPREWESMALAVCHKIESMGASEELTALSMMASALHQSIATFNWSCDKMMDRMCAEHPDLESILRGRK